VKNKPGSATEQTDRLLRLFNGQDEISCEMVQALLPAFVEAEQRGEDVDQNSTYGALLLHLDQCAECLALYEQLAEDLAAALFAEEPLPQTNRLPPAFFPAPIQKGPYLWLHQLPGSNDRFQLTVELPLQRPALATLSGVQQPLFSDTLAEIAGNPLLAVSVSYEDKDSWLQIALREPGKVVTWQVVLESESQRLKAVTDARGVVRFALASIPPDSRLKLYCEAVNA
jgi:hypothetical protein